MKIVNKDSFGGKCSQATVIFFVWSCSTESDPERKEG